MDFHGEGRAVANDRLAQLRCDFSRDAEKADVISETLVLSADTAEKTMNMWAGVWAPMYATHFSAEYALRSPSPYMYTWLRPHAAFPCWRRQSL